MPVSGCRFLPEESQRGNLASSGTELKLAHADIGEGDLASLPPHATLARTFRASQKRPAKRRLLAKMPPRGTYANCRLLIPARRVTARESGQFREGAHARRSGHAARRSPIAAATRNFGQKRPVDWPNPAWPEVPPTRPTKSGTSGHSKRAALDRRTHRVTILWRNPFNPPRRARLRDGHDVLALRGLVIRPWMTPNRDVERPTSRHAP